MDYLIIGRGRPVIFFSGFGLKPRFYLPLLSELSLKYKIVIPDLTTTADFFKIDRELLKIFKKEEVGQFVCAVGHSMGAALLMELVLRKQLITKKIVGLDGLFFSFRLSLWHATLKMISDTIDDYRQIINWRNLFLSISDLGINFITNRHYRRIFFQQMSYCKSINLFNQLKLIDQPTLLIWGSRDKIIKVNQAKRVINQLNSGFLKIVPGNHLWFLQNTDNAYLLINQFINEN